MANGVFLSPFMDILPPGVDRAAAPFAAMAKQVVPSPNTIGSQIGFGPSSRRNRRKVYLAIALLAICVAGVWPICQLSKAFLKGQARRALSARDAVGAMEWLDRCERWFGADADTSFLRARASRKTGDWAAFAGHLKRARSLGFPATGIEREQWLAQAQSGQLRDVEERLPLLLADPRDDGAEICEAFVNGYFLNERMDEAARILEAWIADFPRDPEPLFIRGRIRAESQFLKDAEQDFRAALSLDPAYWLAALELANTLVLERDIAGALEIYRRTAAIPAHRFKARLGETKCLRLLERLGEARKSAERLLADDPGSREGLLELGLVDLEQGRYAEATASLKEALAINPRSLLVRQSLTRALRGTGDLEGAKEQAAYVEQAQAALQRAERLRDRVAEDPDNADLRYEIGKIYLRYAVPERGINWLKSALNCDPEHQAAKRALDDYFANQSTTEPMASTKP